MNGKLLLSAASALTLALSLGDARGDVFAVVPAAGEILRFDSTTGAQLDVYSYPEFYVGPRTSLGGLAFDGQNLYLTSGSPSEFFELYQFSIADRTWAPPIPGFLFPPAPSGAPLGLVGLGYSDDTEPPALIAVSRTFGSEPQGFVHFFAAPLAGDLFPTPDLAEPVALPPGYLPTGVDVDPATKEIWVSADLFDGSTRTNSLIRMTLAGTLLGFVTPELHGGIRVLGVGFDDGKLFLGGRDITNQTNYVYEIDRTTGAVMNSFVVPNNSTMPGLLAGITGGRLVPEPTSCALAAACIGFVALANHRPTNRPI